MKAFQYESFSLDGLKRVDLPEPQPGPYEVAVRFRAASLNYRDLLFAWGVYNPKAKFPTIPLSDGAGEVVAVGSEVTRWKTGDRVCPIFTQGWLEGPYNAAKAGTTLGGGDLPGVLREIGAFHEQSLVRIPDYLSFEEAATLPCAAVTVWNSLVVFGNLKAGETVLTLGTGGVSMFALQLAKLHGARVISTSSSDEKLERVRALGADETINYKTHPAWEKEVLRLTDGVGVDHVVEVGGAGTISKSIASARIAGKIGVIGVLAQGEGVNPMFLLMKTLALQGIFVGSREMFEHLNAAITTAQLKPVIDRTFPFDEAVEALRHMETGSHFGKIVLKY
ncbi:zinc-dependent alcohol dehydrogenase family protein [Lacipirellula parvula]|uniref:Alcohol dehydrogenase n=1 Tax=Lacipirellula parvula TaxID=2650471 RepID=A0A5K7XKN1_9BACT|nr:NAD(P)-dependent alcohol dehydrogenase [Lacipirellula parvula]BBO35751.1 alcohol dehydrogenase [Lacipirellula parvula]